MPAGVYMCAILRGYVILASVIFGMHALAGARRPFPFRPKLGQKAGPNKNYVITI